MDKIEEKEEKIIYCEECHEKLYTCICPSELYCKEGKCYEECDYCMFGPTDICIDCASDAQLFDDDNDLDYELGPDDCDDCGAWLGEKCKTCGHYDYHSCRAGDSTVWCECDREKHLRILSEIDARYDRGYE